MRTTTMLIKYEDSLPNKNQAISVSPTNQLEDEVDDLFADEPVENKAERPQTLGGVPVPANDAGILTWALYASSLSFYVFPLRKGTKKPARERWQADSTRDEATMRGWFSGNDYDGYLIDCGKSNIAVADWDCNTFEEYIAARRKLNLPTAPTFRVQSGRVGFGAHEYY